MDFERGLLHQRRNEFLDRAKRECDRCSAPGADNVVPMPQRVADVGGMPIRLDQPGKDIERGEDLEGAIDRGAPDRSAVARTHIRNQLLGGERVSVAEDRLDDGSPRLGQAIPMLNEDGFDFAVRQHLGGWCFGGRRCVLNHDVDATTDLVSIGPLRLARRMSRLPYWPLIPNIVP